MGNGKMAERGGGRRDFFGDGGDGRPRGSPLPVLVGVRRDGSPHPRGHGRDGFSPPSSRGQAVRGGRGWVPASARTTGGEWVAVFVFAGAGCERGDGDGFPSASSRGQAVSGGEGDGSPHPRGHGRDGFPLTVFAGASSLRGDGDGCPHARGQREGMGSRFRLHGGKL